MSTFEEKEDDPLLWEPLQTKKEAVQAGREPSSVRDDYSFSVKAGSTTQESTNTWQSPNQQQQQQQQEHQILTTKSATQEPDTSQTESRNTGDASRSSSTGHAQAGNSAGGGTRDDRIHANLVEHPMQLVWSRFFLYFGQELWEIDLHLRFSIILVLCGFGINVILSSSYFFWSPRWILFAIILLGPWVYLERNQVVGHLEALGQTIISPERMARTLSHLEPSTVRSLFLSFLLIPTLFETRALIFLSHIKAEAGWSLYNVAVAACLLVIQYFLYRYVRLSPRECSQKAVIFLYGSALLVSCWRTDWQRLPWLAAPFCTSTGVLLWSRQPNDQGLANVLRQSLRRTLRDVVEHVGTTVQQDEMLQLALLRWLVDYWTTTSTSQENTNESNDDVTTSSSPAAARESSMNTSTPLASSAPATTTTESATRSGVASRELDWSDVFSMLRVTADQMSWESRNLRPQGTSAAAYATQQSTNTDTPHDTSAPPSNNQPPPQTQNAESPPFTDSDPFQNLKSMLLSWDIDETAKPAVQTIQRGLLSFPPGRKFAIFFSVARRSPSFFALLYQIAFGHHFCWSALLILSVLISFELVRVHEWILSCYLSGQDINELTDYDDQLVIDHAEVLQGLDPMVILLSDDLHQQDRPSSLLRVWWNLGDSVSALQTGLTTARCAQSTAIASDFADNIMSLARFGLEVQEHGWNHGLMVAVREIFTFNNPDLGPSAGYAHAAYGAFYNSHRLYRNATALSEEGELGNSLLPLLGLVPVLIGQGWLWSQHQPKPLRQTQQSTVVIEEIIEEDDNGKSTLQVMDSDIALEKSPESMREKPAVGLDCTSREFSNSSQPYRDTAGLAQKPVESAVVPTKQAETEKRAEITPPLLRPTDVRPSRPMQGETAGITTASIAEANKQAALRDQLEDRARLMDLIAKCQVNGLMDERDKDRICENMARFGSSVDPIWLNGNIRTLEGLLEEHEQTVVAPLESSTDDLYSVSLRSSIIENVSLNTGAAMDLAASDEWEGLGTNSSKASLDSLVPVETHEVEDAPAHSDSPDITPNPPVQASQKSDTSKILLSVAAIGAAAFGAFVASRSPPQDQADRTRTTGEDEEKNSGGSTSSNKNGTDVDWVQVERRNNE